MFVAVARVDVVNRSQTEPGSIGEGQIALLPPTERVQVCGRDRNQSVGKASIRTLDLVVDEAGSEQVLQFGLRGFVSADAKSVHQVLQEDRERRVAPDEGEIKAIRCVGGARECIN